MRDRFRDFPLTVEELRCMMKKEEAKKAKWIAIGVGVVAALIGLVIWIVKKREKDLDDECEYIDDDFDELDDDYEEFDESIYDDDTDEQVEYVKINDFMKDEEVEEEETEKKEETETSESEKEDEK